MENYEIAVLRNAFLRPGMVGLDGSFREYAAFISGFYMGLRKNFSEGFSEWIAYRSDAGGWNLVWPVLVLREAGLKSWNENQWHALGREDDARAVATLIVLLQEFLDVDLGRR
ncbi:hypothetical protein AB0M36_34770 [Actinoplanes sp. NPDC051346]|uniref:hypothetical protein n=1 Tax=Actinoplanes sp. NPDC051346 TaxID=3155048 RepID=UPI0034436B28